MSDFDLPDSSPPPATPPEVPPIPPSLLGGALSLADKWQNYWSSGLRDASGGNATPHLGNPAYDAVADDSTRVTRMKASAALVAFGGRPLAWAGPNPDPNIARVSGGDPAASDSDVQTAQLQEAQQRPMAQKPAQPVQTKPALKKHGTIKSSTIPGRSDLVKRKHSMQKHVEKRACPD